MPNIKDKATEPVEVTTVDAATGRIISTYMASSAETARADVSASAVASRYAERMLVELGVATPLPPLSVFIGGDTPTAVIL